MYQKLRLIFLLVCISHFFNLNAEKPLLTWKGSKNGIYRQYTNLLRRYERKYCQGEERKFSKMYENYTDAGDYIPSYKDGNKKSLIDYEAIQAGLGEIDKKIAWQKELEKNWLQFEKNFKGEVFDKLEQLINNLLDLKKRRDLTREKNSENLNKNILEKMNEVKIEYRKIVEKFKFFKGHAFPVDHYELRRSYEIVKIKNKRSSNKIYFKRKIIEDGSYNNHGRKSDFFFRALLSTVYLRLVEKSPHDLTEDMRYDLEFIIKIGREFLSLGSNQLKIRLINWRKKSENLRQFYKKILGNKNLKKKEGPLYLKMLSKENSRSKLKNHVISKQANAYKFWNAQSEIMKAIYATETILLNEIGDLDKRSGIERKDIIQVILNRHQNRGYNNLTKRSSLYKKLISNISVKKIKAEKWLNVMYRKGEFSFTYFFMRSSLHSYCPDMGRKADFLRRENVLFALEKFENPDWSFDAVRYFSRHSMTGRIDMATLWRGHSALEERVGTPIKKNYHYFKKIYNEDKWQYLYGFKNLGMNYQVIKYQRPVGNNEIYQVAVKAGVPHFYTYRNPHYFRYFSKNK